jgi:hypothetical protein
MLSAFPVPPELFIPQTSMTFRLRDFVKVPLCIARNFGCRFVIFFMIQA